MEYNLPTGPGLLIVSDISLAIVNEKFNQIPIDGGAGKIRKLDEIILDRMLSIGQKPKITEMEADWIATKSSLFYINPYLGLTGGVFEFPFAEWIVNISKNRAYGLFKMFSSMKLISREDSNISYDFKTGTSAQLNIVYIFSKFQSTT
tara:strand:- start:22 stop:465 length:444 start_codon:yes stop_codon:yes gene_type:complete